MILGFLTAAFIVFFNGFFIIGVVFLVLRIALILILDRNTTIFLNVVYTLFAVVDNTAKGCWSPIVSKGGIST